MASSQSLGFDHASSDTYPPMYTLMFYHSRYVQHAAENAYLVIPVLGLLLFSTSWLFRTYGTLMAKLLSRLSRALVETIQLIILAGSLFMIFLNVCNGALYTTHPDFDFLNGVSTFQHYFAASAGSLLFAAVGIYAIEILASGDMSKAWADPMLLKPLRCTWSVLARKKADTEASRTTRTPPPTTADMKGKTARDDATDDKDDDTAESMTESDESPLSEDPELSALKSTELAGWQSISVSKAKARAKTQAE